MAAKNVYINAPEYVGATDLVLLVLDKTTGAILNGSGDNLTHLVNGQFSCVVTENVPTWTRVNVLKSGVPVISGGWLYIESDVVGDYLVDDPSALVTQPDPVVTPPDTGDISDITGFMTAIGPQRVKTKDVEVEQHDILKLQKVMERNSTPLPSLASMHFVVAQPKCIPTPKENPCGDCCDME